MLPLLFLLSIWSCESRFIKLNLDIPKLFNINNLNSDEGLVSQMNISLSEDGSPSVSLNTTHFQETIIESSLDDEHVPYPGTIYIFHI